jgi:hydroxymethylpyrimidine/phosphomethylpyrimidine kinase
MKKIHYPCVLTIAGTDPSGGAGIQADIKAISAMGCYAASVVTALVAQNTQGVQAIQEIPADFVTQQLDSVFNDLTISAVKIGMLHDTKIIEVISSVLRKIKPKNIVLDPVMVAKNGCDLLKPGIIHFLKEELFPLVNLITPNLFEAEKIAMKKIKTFSEMELTAEEIGKTFNVNVLLKGGHLNTNQSSDVLYSKEDNTHHWFHAERINTIHTHGTGCTLSSTIASRLAKGDTLQNAIHNAKHYLTQAIQHGSTLHIGKGRGPVHHFYFLEEFENAI